METSEKYETVNHPKHYNNIPGIECIDVVEHYGFNVGTVIKHLWRAGLKPGSAELEDLKKAAFYLAREIALVEKRMKGDL